LSRDRIGILWVLALVSLIKDYKIGIFCFSAMHAALKNKSKNWFAWNQNNVSRWSNMSTHGLLFQWDWKHLYFNLYFYSKTSDEVCYSVEVVPGKIKKKLSIFFFFFLNTYNLLNNIYNNLSNTE
jgi:hypothetical protein